MRKALQTVLLALVLPAVAGAEDLGGAGGFTAKSFTYQEGQESSAEQYKVYLAPEGKRIEGIPPRGLTMISPAGKSKRWFVDPEAKVYAVDPNRNKGQSLGGVLSHEPCQGFASSERVGKEKVHGRMAEKWICEHPAFGKVTQWFDPAVNTVIKDRTAKGEIQELREVEVGQQSADLFRFEPDEDYRKVAVIQLFQ